MGFPYRRHSIRLDPRDFRFVDSMIVQSRMKARSGATVADSSWQGPWSLRRSETLERQSVGEARGDPAHIGGRAGAEMRARPTIGIA